MSDTKVKVAVRVRPMNRRGNRRAALGEGAAGSRGAEAAGGCGEGAAPGRA